jgi:hypothetical protein
MHLQPHHLPRLHPPARLTPTQNLADRSAQWAKKREQWRNEQLRSKENTELADCTFAPTTHTERDVARALTPRRSIYGGDGKAWGTSEYVERQRAARERHDSERERQYYTGSNWRNEPTVPQSPRLGRADLRAIPSLSKPISAPVYFGNGGGRLESPDGRHGSPPRGYPGARGESVGSSIPSPSHFSQLRGGEAHATKPLVPFTVHEHRAAFGLTQ